MPRVLTIKQLEDIGACRSQIEKFRNLFGDSVSVTIELAVEHADDFDWFWGRRLLGRDVMARFVHYDQAICCSVYVETSYSKYIRALASAWAAAYISESLIETGGF